MSGLRRFVEEPPPPRAEPVAELCEMCATAIQPQHQHVVDVESRSLLCACRACYLLFATGGASGSRFRAVPERYLYDAGRTLSLADWEGLGIPVATAFFLPSDNGVAAFYPSPAGATECLLDLDAWSGLAGRHPLLAAALPQVEAVLARAGESEVECYLVPIDACYHLVGIVRTYWQGFDGGAEAGLRIDEFFAGIRSRADPLQPEE
jgi:hypothetical protein